MSSHLPLLGIRVQLAGSVPESATAEQSAGIRSFVQTFTSAVLKEGGILVHGSHPTFQDPLKAAAEIFVDAEGSREALTLVRSHRFATTDDQLAEMAAQREYAAVHVIPPAFGTQAESLVPMREWMVERCDVAVAIGGNWYEVNKTRAGVPGELEEMLQRGKPAFIVAGFGGAIAGYLKDDKAVIS